jgi:hypothetical protein
MIVLCIEKGVIDVFPGMKNVPPGLEKYVVLRSRPMNKSNEMRNENDRD